MAPHDHHRVRRGSALIIAALAALPVITAELPGDALHRLRADRTLRTLSGLFDRIAHGAVDLLDADLPWQGVRPAAAFIDWLAWQWFGLEASLHRAALVALLAVASAALRSPDRERQDLAPALLGAAFLTHPVCIDLLATLRGREALFALAAGVIATRALDQASRRETFALAAVGALLVGGCEPLLLPWFLSRAVAASRERAALYAGAAVGVVATSSALLSWPASPASALASTAWRSLRVTLAPVGLRAWSSLDAPSSLSLVAAGVWVALAALAWRRGAHEEARSASLLVAGAVTACAMQSAASGAAVDAAYVAVVYAAITLLSGLLARTRRGADVALAIAAVTVALGAARAFAWRDDVAMARADLAARPHDGRAALSVAYAAMRSPHGEAHCARAIDDPATRDLARACVAVEAAIAGRADEAARAASEYRATARSSRALVWDVGRALSLRPAAERAAIRRALGLSQGGAQ